MTPNFTLVTPPHAADYAMEDIMENITELTIEDLCRACTAHADIIIELVSEGVIEGTATQQNLPPEYWRFTGLHLHRAKVAMRLHRELGVNFAGAALALQLMDELTLLRAKLHLSAI